MYNYLPSIEIGIKSSTTFSYSSGLSFTTPEYTHLTLEITGLVNGCKVFWKKETIEDFWAMERH